MNNKKTLSIVLISSAIIVFFYEIFIQGQNLFLGDNLLAIVPHKIFVLENLKRGILPLWNPHQWAGFPEVADVTFGLFNPFSLIHFIFPDMLSVNLIAFICYFLSFYGTFLFLRREGKSQTASFLGGMIFTFSGSMINISPDIIRLESICFFPWILLFARSQKFLSLIFVLVLDLLVGQTQHFYMAVFFSFCLILYFSFREKNFQSLFKFLISLFLSILLSAFLIFPQIELLGLSSRANATSSYNTIWSLHPFSFIRFFLANFWGRHNEGSFWGPDVTYAFGYTGFFTLILSFVFWKRIVKKALFFALFSFFTILIALGKFNPIHQLLLIIPGFSLFRNPVSWLSIYSFSVALMLAEVFNEKDLWTNKNLKKAVFILGVILLSIALCILALNYYDSGTFYQLLKLISGLIHKNLSGFHNPQVDSGIAILIARNVFLLGTLSLIFSKFFSIKSLILVVFLDLLFFAKSDLSVAKNTSDTFSRISGSPSVSFLKKNLGNYRFLSTSEFMPVRGISIYMTDYFRRPPYLHPDFWSLSSDEIKSQTKYWRELELLPPDVFVAYGLSSINGYAGFYLKNFADYFSQPSNNLSSSARRIMNLRKENNDANDPSRINFNYISLNDQRLDNLSVKYILAAERLEMPHHKEVMSKDNVYIYESLNVKPRSSVLNLKGEEVFVPQLIDQNPNSVRILFGDYLYQKGDYLLLRDTFYPGWKAYDQNNQKLKIEKESIFRKVELNKNVESVIFSYEPSSFFAGLYVSLLTFVVLLIWTTYVKCFRKKRLS